VKDLKVNDLFIIEEKNKKELAENLHDHLGQALAMIRLTLKKIQGNAVFCGLDGEINYALSLTEKCIKYSRDMVTELSPMTLHKFGLGVAIENLIENLQLRHSLKINFDHDKIPDLGENQRIYLYRSISELLINIVKHSKASMASIRFMFNDRALIIKIEDNGIGIKPNQNFGFGLMSVMERINCLNGHFLIKPQPKGTLISIEIPLDPSEHPR